jgi:curved DNA-binding protein CbpA
MRRGMREAWRDRNRGRDAADDDPFALLGLPRRADLSDDDVRAAWRRIAAATHPDRDDGGDPAWFGAAAAAYATLRTGFGRGEALADLADLAGSGDGNGKRPRRGRVPRHGPARRQDGRRQRGRLSVGRLRVGELWVGELRVGRLRVGRPRDGRKPGATLAVRAVVAGAIAGLTLTVAGWAPASIGVLVGLLTWLIAAAGRALAWGARR